MPQVMTKCAPLNVYDLNKLWTFEYWDYLSRSPTPVVQLGAWPKHTGLPQCLSSRSWETGAQLTHKTCDGNDGHDYFSFMCTNFSFHSPCTPHMYIYVPVGKNGRMTCKSTTSIF